MHADGVCNANGAGLSCSAIDCYCDMEYQGNQCQNCNTGYYAFTGTDGTDPKCDGEQNYHKFILANTLVIFQTTLIFPLACMHSDGGCNINGVGSACNATDCNCKVEYQGNQCQNCNTGHYVSAGTDGTDPTCSGKQKHTVVTQIKS